MNSEEQILRRIRQIFVPDVQRCRTTQEICAALPRDDIAWITGNKNSVPQYLESVAEPLLSLSILERQFVGQEIFRMRDVPQNTTETWLHQFVARIVSRQPKTADEIRAHVDTNPDAVAYLEKNFFGRVDLFVAFYPGTFTVKADGAPPIVCLRRRSKTPSVEAIKSPPKMLDTDLFVADVVRQAITALSGKGGIYFSTMGACMKDVRKPLQSRGYDTLQTFFTSFSEVRFMLVMDEIESRCLRRVVSPAGQIFCLSNEDTTNVAVSLVYATAEHTFAYLEESKVYPTIIETSAEPSGEAKKSKITEEINIVTDSANCVSSDAAPTIPVQFITSADEAHDAVEILSRYSIIAVDCEGLNKGADICLIQITARSKNLENEIVYIFDVRKRDSGMLENLKKLLENPSVAKVLHDSRLDVAGMRILGIEIANLIDTQVAQGIYLQLSRIACVEQQRPAWEPVAQSDIQSLASVLRQHCGILETDQKDSIRLRMNLDPDLWRKEIDASMIQYAAFDVIHLIEAEKNISQKCQNLVCAIVKRASGMYGQGTLRTTDLAALMNPIISN